MEEKISDTERKMIAGAEIDEEISGDRLAAQFRVLEKGAGSANADLQLLELKQRMGMIGAGSGGADSKQLGKGASEEHAEADAEVEELPAEEKKTK